ncbi:hypothetical protein M885DRAFT_520293 [Pelagophyceae sp. CCMP2097]|nr:hypothetical protein M885DRAFT_520293 [Pelagophyceae sp. CCMP2097]
MIVLPGEEITAAEGGWMRGHGTYVEPASRALVACAAGSVERVNKLVSVRPTGGRYTGEVGDLVVGRVIEVAHKSWKLEIGGARRATLALSSVNLPDDAQRIRTQEDALAMRSVFAEGDVVCAEVQAVHNDGQVHLHTRSNRYGRLRNGTLVVVRAAQVRRLPQHFASPAGAGVDVALGNNGWVWVQRAVPEAWQKAETAETGGGSGAADALLSAAAWNRLRNRHADTPTSAADEQRVCRAANAVRVLGAGGAAVTADSIATVVRDSQHLAPSAMLRAGNVRTLVDAISLSAAPKTGRAGKRRKRSAQGDDDAPDDDAPDDDGLDDDGLDAVDDDDDL